MIRLLKFFIASLFLPSLLFAQQLTYERMSVYAYEDMSDWLRRFPGMYPMDYGVAGVPVVFRPWGLSPWNVGVERDGIPWNRISDGLYDSNLDSPEELKSLSYSSDGIDPLGTIRLNTRLLPTDTATTEVRLREGYYGFGRVDFAHAQKLSDRVSGEGRGRLFWYDGLRANGNLTYSKARFYALSGKLKVSLNDQWRGGIEYGGSNVDAQSPFTFRGEDSLFHRPQIYSEREHGTARLEMRSDGLEFDFGLHARQDREIREESGGIKYFGLRERFWYGFAEGRMNGAKGGFGGRVAGESAEFNFPGVDEISEDALSFSGSAHYDVSLAKIKGNVNFRNLIGNDSERSSDLTNKSAYLSLLSKRILGLAIKAEGAVGDKAVPQYWRYANLPNNYRPLLVSNENASNSYYGGRYQGVEAETDFSSKFGTWAAGLDLERGSGTATLLWRSVNADEVDFLTVGDTTYLYSMVKNGGDWIGPEINCDIPIVTFLRLQSWSSVQCDKDEMSRALDTRSFTRLMFSQDFFKAPLHINSYVAYEHIGRHSAVSDFESKVLGPAHLVHFRVEGTIEGVTLIWGAENITGQHYEYLPGYMLIRKEEYFGLKWTLKL